MICFILLLIFVGLVYSLWKRYVTDKNLADTIKTRLSAIEDEKNRVAKEFIDLVEALPSVELVTLKDEIAIKTEVEKRVAGADLC